MKNVWILVTAAASLVLLYLYAKFAQKPALQGGAINPNTPTAVNLTSQPTVAAIPGNTSIFAADQKAVAGHGSAPNLVWEPKDSTPINIIGTPGGTLGGASGVTLPNIDTNPVAPIDISEQFWSADSVTPPPPNPSIEETGGM